MMTDSPDGVTRGVSGKLSVLFLLLCGLAAAVGTYLWQSSQTAQARAYWGTTGAQVLRTAEAAEAWRLEPAEDSDDDADTVTWGDRRWRIVERKPIVRGVGTTLTFARRTLVYDHTFRWTEPLDPTCPPAAQWALRFDSEHGPWTLLFDLEPGVPPAEADCARLVHVEGDRALRLTRGGLRLLRDAFAEGFDPERPEGSSTLEPSPES